MAHDAPTPAPLELDIRPLVATGRPPMGPILETVGRLVDGQAFVLIAPFEPAPLYQLLGRQGFTRAVEETGDGAWRIVFSRE